MIEDRYGLPVEEWEIEALKNYCKSVLDKAEKIEYRVAGQIIRRTGESAKCILRKMGYSTERGHFGMVRPGKDDAYMKKCRREYGAI